MFMCENWPDPSCHDSWVAVWVGFVLVVGSCLFHSVSHPLHVMSCHFTSMSCRPFCFHFVSFVVQVGLDGLLVLTCCHVLLTSAWVCILIVVTSVLGELGYLTDQLVHSLVLIQWPVCILYWSFSIEYPGWALEWDEWGHAGSINSGAHSKHGKWD